MGFLAGWEHLMLPLEIRLKSSPNMRISNNSLHPKNDPNINIKEIAVEKFLLAL